MFNIYNKTLTRVAKIDNFISAYWYEYYNQHSRFTLELAYNETLATKLGLDYTINFQLGTQQMTIKSIVADRTTITLTGYSTAIAYADRVLVGQLANGIVEDSIFDAIEDVETFPYLQMRKTGVTETISDTEIDNREMDSAIQTACQTANVGYRVVKSGKMLYFELYAPEENKNAKYGGIFGGLNDFEMSMSNLDSKNIAVVRGEDGQIVYVGDATGDDRKECYLDKSAETQEDGETDAEYTARLYAYGVTELATRNEVLAVTISADNVVLGEIGTCILAPYGVKIKARVQTVSIKIENNKTTKTIEIGEIAVM